MAGVVAEIDLVLSQKSLQKLDTDLAAVSKQIGTGLSSGATPAAQNFAKNLVTTLQTRLKEESGVLAKQLADGTLSPTQYRAAAQRLGKSIADDLKKGISSGGKLDLFGGEGGLALRNQLEGISTATKQATTAVTELDQASIHAHPGFGRMRSALFTLASQATGTNSAIGSLASGLLLFGGGSVVAVAVAAGLAVIAKGYELITSTARAAAKASADFLAKSKEEALAARPAWVALTEEIDKTQKDIAVRVAKIEEDRKRFVARPPEGYVSKELKEDLKNLEVLTAKLARLRAEGFAILAGRTDPATLSAGAGHPGIGLTDEANAKIRERDRKAQEDADRKEEARVRKLNQLLEDEARKQLQIAEDQRTISAEAQHALADLTATTIDNLQLQIDEFRERVLAAFGTIPPEEQKVIDAWKAQLEQARILEPIDKELAAFDHRMETANFKVVKMSENWKKIGETIATVGQGLLDMARGLGLVSDRMDKVAQGAISIGKNLPAAIAKGDPAAIVGVVGGVVSVIGGIFGHKNNDPERLAQNQQWYEAAIGGDANALEQLRIHSVVSRNGSAGWGSPAAAADAKAKYDAAMKATAPGRAASAADAAAQAEQDRLDQLRQGEEAQVSARTEQERRANIQTLLASGGPQDLTDKLQKLEQEFERLVAASPLGEDSPLARDAKQRADDAARDLDRAVADAKRAAGAEITPGFTVQRTITESSAGRVVGELITSNVWLEKIFGALSGVGPGTSTGGVSGGLGDIHVYVGGEEVTAIVSRGQASRVQNIQGLNGNASLPS